MLNETRNPVGMPKGYIQYPVVMQFVEQSLTTEPQTINQITEKVKHLLRLKQDQYPKTLNRDTVKHYLDALVIDNKATKQIIGERMLTYRLP